LFTLPSVMCFERYWIPELFVALQRNDSRNSKFLTVPPFQMMKVFPFAGFSAVVSPWITPSLTLHNRGSPSQPVKSFPLNSCCIPDASAGAATGASAASANEGTNKIANITRFRVISSCSKEVRRVA
jgi:hypothetical protein